MTGADHDELKAAIDAMLERRRAVARAVRPREVAAPPRFRNRRALESHVEKHPLAAREERWHRIFAMDLLSAARDERAAGLWGDACERLAADYEGFLASILLERSREGRGHVHRLSCGPGDGPDGLEVTERIYAWDLETRTLVIAARRVGPQEWGNGGATAEIHPNETLPAGNPVSPGDPSGYLIRTGYRVWAERSEARFRKDVRRRLLDAEWAMARVAGSAEGALWTVEHDPAPPDAGGPPERDGKAEGQGRP